MKRVTAGDDVSLTFDVNAAGETYTAKFTDARYRFLTSSTTVNGANVTITVKSNAWQDGQSGHGRIEITKEDGGLKTVVKAERIRIMPGLNADYIGGLSDYGS